MRVDHSARRAGLLGVFLLVCAAPTVHAQQGSPYGNGAYPQNSGQPIQPAQNIYYGNYQNNTVPGYIYPRPYQMPPNTGYSGNGITYYYVQNPNGPSTYPFTSPYGTPRVYQAPPARPTTYPIPANTPPATPPYVPTQEELLGDGRKPTVSFHRATNETFWINADYVGAYIRPMRLSSGPLVTTGSPGDSPPGALGQRSTGILFGNNVDYNLLSGVRVQAGLFLDCQDRFSIDVGGFFVLPSTQSFAVAANANGNPVLARPVFNVNANREGAVFNSLPGIISGSLNIESKSEMQGIEFNARYHSYIRESLHADALVGFRYLRLSERLGIREQINPISNTFLTYLGNFVAAPNSLMDQDSFQTLNQFFGPQIGGRLSWEHNWFTIEGFGKLAVGASRQQTNISGSTTMLSPNGNQTALGGVLALPSNIGSYNRTILGIVPELGLNLGIDLTQHVRLNFGYSFLMWNHVVRPAGQIDRNNNNTQAPGSGSFGPLVGPPSPAYRFNDEFFWNHTFNVGLEIHY